ncbi:transmembrane protein 225B-like [Trichosurus vulpecula]|uniref:transmembrane protein 225B-like n=1 Tax=Trichosurus vulpecula TaxID=9337 RepID=UPI00186B26D5|nr:transmembrane protein 225B-like [Trichosurus vulpecula]
MEIKPHIQENTISLKSISWSSTSMHRSQIQYRITKKNPLSLRLMAVILTTLSWSIMTVVCIHPRWVILDHSKRKLWQNTTLDFALWDNCDQCSPFNKLSVYILVARGIMFLNLIFTSLLIVSMICSFRRIFNRISNLDFIFSIANYISGLASLLCITLFGLQLLEIFIEDGREFHVKWPFYFSGFGILSFFMAGTICLNSHKNSWNISYLSPDNLLTQSKKQRLFGSLWHQSPSSVVPGELTTSSTVSHQEASIIAILNNKA